MPKNTHKFTHKISTIYCNLCGRPMREYEWEGRYICDNPDCGDNIALVQPYSNEVYYTYQSNRKEHNPSTMSKPYGCRACGNTAYPYCKYQCSMYNN